MFKSRKLGLVAITFPKRHKIHAFGNSFVKQLFLQMRITKSEQACYLTHKNYVYIHVEIYDFRKYVCRKNVPYKAHYLVTASVLFNIKVAGKIFLQLIKFLKKKKSP